MHSRCSFAASRRRTSSYPCCRPPPSATPSLRRWAWRCRRRRCAAHARGRVGLRHLSPPRTRATHPPLRSCARCRRPSPRHPCPTCRTLSPSTRRPSSPVASRRGPRSNGGRESAPRLAGRMVVARRGGCGVTSQPPPARWWACRGLVLRGSSGGPMRPCTRGPTGPTSTAACAPTGRGSPGTPSTTRPTSATRCKSAGGPCSPLPRSLRTPTPRHRRGRRRAGPSCGHALRRRAGC